MAYRDGICDCGASFRRWHRTDLMCSECKKTGGEPGGTSIPIFEPQSMPKTVLGVEGKRLCRVCLKWTDQESGRHKNCATKADWVPPAQDVSRLVSDMAVPSAPPFLQAVFDIETWGLDRSWGVMLMATVLIYGDGAPKLHTFTHRESESFKAGRRGDDSEVFLKLYYTLEPCAIWYGHNALWFDNRWINALCLKYGVAPLRRKLVDPVQVSKKNFALSSNSLESGMDFTGTRVQKMHIGQSVWRDAILNDDPAAWEALRERNVSDVIGLAEYATKVAPFVGLVDFSGSAWRS